MKQFKEFMRGASIDNFKDSSFSRSTKESVPNTLVQEFLDDVFSGKAMEWPNPLGIQDALLRRYLLR